MLNYQSEVEAIIFKVDFEPHFVRATDSVRETGDIAVDCVISKVVVMSGALGS